MANTDTFKLLIFSILLWMMPGLSDANAGNSNQQRILKLTPADVFDAMRQNFRADKSKEVMASYLFDISGPTGGKWWITVRDGTFKMGRGSIKAPDVTFEVGDKDWVRISNGTLNGRYAFIFGRLKILGDKSLARKLDDMFP